MATYYGVRRREDGRGFAPTFNREPRVVQPSGTWSRDRPSPTAKLNQQIVACEGYAEVLELFRASRGDPALDGANLCTCVSTCARRCRAEGAGAARACLEDACWVELLEEVGVQLRDLAPRGLAMVAWGLATLKAGQPLLLKRLAWQVRQKLGQMDARMLANVTWAFATAGVREFEVTMPGGKLYPGIAEHAILHLGDFKPQELANLLWAFATLGIGHGALFERAAATLVGVLDHLNAYDLGQTVWSYSTLRLRHDGLLDAIAVRVKSNRDDHKPINIANLSWAYAKVEYSDDDFYKHLAGLATSMMPRSNPQDLCNVLWALASTRVKEPIFCGAMSSTAVALLSSPRRSGFTSTELACLLWSLGKLGESANGSGGHGELLELVMGALGEEVRARTIGHKDSSMCLWALLSFGLADRAWSFFDGFVATGLDPGVTSLSTMLGAAQRAGDIEHELLAWHVLRRSAAHPLLVAAAGVSAALTCLRKGDARRALVELDQCGAALKPVAWTYIQGLFGGMRGGAEAAAARRELEQPQPKHEGMSHAQLYAKELEVPALLEVAVEPGNARSVIREIQRCVEEREAWLKLAGGEKTVVLERLVRERRPRLIVEVGFYVGYSSTVMGRHLREWGGRLVSIEVDPVHVAIGQVSVALAGLADIVDVWVGHSSDVLPRLLTEFGPDSVDMVFFDQKGTIYQHDLATMLRLGVISDGCAVVADNVLKPGAPVFLWDLQYSPAWHLQIVSLREYESEAIEDWISVASFDAAGAAAGGLAGPPAPRSFESLAFETDAIRWRAMGNEMNVSNWIRHVVHVKDTLELHNIRPTALVESGMLQGFVPLRLAPQQGSM
mmetsp:Transcript_135617/g.433850  ORF Transcript_135617/g.433850 Transcript_135617/m.433850 type:complete len:842 (+) Transcript_135617:132-2657(+)